MDDYVTHYAPYHRAAASWLPWSIGAGVLAVIAMQATILHQQASTMAAVSLMQEALALRAVAAVQLAPTAAPAAAPVRFLLGGLTPSADQALRGDCWLFATTGMLEDSYRRYGVSKGWFKPSEYLRLSRQALLAHT